MSTTTESQEGPRVHWLVDIIAEAVSDVDWRSFEKVWLAVKNRLRRGNEGKRDELSSKTCDTPEPTLSRALIRNVLATEAKQAYPRRTEMAVSSTRIVAAALVAFSAVACGCPAVGCRDRVVVEFTSATDFPDGV